MKSPSGVKGGARVVGNLPWRQLQNNAPLSKFFFQNAPTLANFEFAPGAKYPRNATAKPYKKSNNYDTF